MFYVDHEETVSVTVFNATSAVVELHLTNEPVDTSIFSRVTVNAQPGKRVCKVRKQLESGITLEVGEWGQVSLGKENGKITHKIVILLLVLTFCGTIPCVFCLNIRWYMYLTISVTHGIGQN